ncbi:DUF6371 domain-containing protein [Aestuariibaculum sp. YM273]|uniref:DUF6371 domain-containing protein n=1 Tax=Aestuariibaculum sp. YM273 TaxID=3070659 RepID=UPI0027DBEB1E|nr:DUF6371 domain-containing protein [Aestuariibaculum sp. YM273]WMI64087.1 DUF6371 domain-containing protein [Aestuariibaculum sp. YM273]
MKYKYSLDRSSRKFACPACNRKTFVRYTLTETGEYLDSNLGRCDRESKCAYHNSPKGNTTLGNTSDIKIKSVLQNFHSDCVIGQYGRHHNKNSFISYLLQHFAAIDVRQAIFKYFIGTSDHWNGATIFWQVNDQMKVCAGKVMLYDKTTGKRIKKPYPHINWMHKVLRLDDFVLQQCLFGIHNLCDYTTERTICIVESEKTAVIMSIMQPAYLWLATGSKSNLKEALLKPLKNHNVIVFPDKTEYETWNTKVQYLNSIGFNVSCSALLERQNIEEGSDLVDYLKLTKLVV